MSDLLEIGLSDDDLLGLVVAGHEETAGTIKKSKKKRSKAHERKLDRT